MRNVSLRPRLELRALHRQVIQHVSPPLLHCLHLAPFHNLHAPCNCCCSLSNARFPLSKLTCVQVIQALLPAPPHIPHQPGLHRSTTCRPALRVIRCSSQPHFGFISPYIYLLFVSATKSSLLHFITGLCNVLQPSFPWTPRPSCSRSCRPRVAALYRPPRHT
jgi:hypothetical protein